jgi:hypothetical protein
MEAFAHAPRRVPNRYMVLFAQFAQTVALALLAQILAYAQSPAFPLMVAFPQMVVFASKVPFTPIVLYAQLVAFAYSGLGPVKPPPRRA